MLVHANTRKTKISTDARTLQASSTITTEFQRSHLWCINSARLRSILSIRTLTKSVLWNDLNKKKKKRLLLSLRRSKSTKHPEQKMVALVGKINSSKSGSSMSSSNVKMRRAKNLLGQRISRLSWSLARARSVSSIWLRSSESCPLRQSPNVLVNTLLWKFSTRSRFWART